MSQYWEISLTDKELKDVLDKLKHWLEYNETIDSWKVPMKLLNIKD